MRKIAPTNGKLAQRLFAMWLAWAAFFGASSTSFTAEAASPAPGGYRAAVMADNPVSYWRLGETGGASALDERGTNPGVYVNQPTLGAASLVSSDMANTAVGFDGAYDRVRIVSAPSLRLSSPISLEAWIKPAVLPAAGKFTSILTKAESYSLQFNGPRLELTIIQSGVRRRLQAPVGAVQVGQTYHVVGTYDGSTQRLYLNGAQVASAPLSGSITSNGTSVFVGSWNGSSEAYKGTIDDAAIYNSTLSASRVLAHFQAGTATTSPPPLPTPTPTCTSGAFGAFSSTNPPGACWRPYSDASPFNTPVSASPQVLPNSSAIVGNWLSTWSATNRTSAPRFTAGLADTTNDYDHPAYYSQPSDPLYALHCTEAWGRCPIEGMQIHVPSAARPAGGTDGHMAVIDQASGWEYDFWQVQQKPANGGTLAISWGGRTMIDGSGLGSPGTAGNFGIAAGIIRPEELAAGQIDHALFMVVKCTNGTSVAPAGRDVGRTCSSMGLSNANAPAMGQHFYLDMSDAQIEALSAPAWQKTVLKAMAHYGLYVGDTGGGSLKIESSSSYTSFGQADPWVKLAKDAGIIPWHDSSTGKDNYSFNLSGAVDWGAHLKVIAG